MISLRSEITRQVLNYFFLNPHESIYINALQKKLNLDKRNLVRKLKEFEKEGILKSERKGNLKFYSLNKNYPLYREYRNIVLKTVGLEAKLRKILSEEKGVEEAYIYGSYASNRMDASSDIDLLVIGSHSVLSLQRKISKLEKEVDREINVVNMDEKEYRKRLKSKDPFLQSVFSRKFIKLI